VQQSLLHGIRNARQRSFTAHGGVFWCMVRSFRRIGFTVTLRRFPLSALHAVVGHIAA
jgi:hypothetical protein